MARAHLRDIFKAFYGALENGEYPYFAYGGIAVAVWGDPRETQDVDAVVSVDESDCAALLAALTAAGFRANEEEAKTFPIDGWIRLEQGGRHADVTLGRTPFDRSALGRRRRATLFDTNAWLASPEDLILYKLVAHRFKDLADAESVLARQSGRLDVAYLRQWAEEIAAHTGKFEVPGKLQELLARMPPGETP